ncbi:MAG: aminopeptidase P family protein [Phycisphaerae bacterium]|nr:aminopeptidase P family protein [Phycisphaerae bacterium]
MLKQPSFTQQEYQDRLARVQRAMADRGLGLLVCHNLANICYLCGFQTLGSYGYGFYELIVPADGQPTLFASDFESHNARIFSWLADVVTYDVPPDADRGPVAVLANLLTDRGWAEARIGVETGHYAMTVGQYRQLTARLSKADLVDATDLVDTVKIVKSSAEIDVLKRAAALTTAGMLDGIDAARPGATDNAVAAAMYARVIRDGGEYFSLQPIVTTGRRSGIPHSTFRRQTLASGDNGFLELSAAVERYSAPCLRTVCLGQPSDAVKRAFDGCLAGTDSLIENIRPGASGRQVARRAAAALRAVEPDLLWHGYYAYSVGLTFPPACSDCVSPCEITEKNDLTLAAGMVFHASISLRQVGQFGVTLGDTVLVTETGSQRLTQVPRQLFVR